MISALARGMKSGSIISESAWVGGFQGLTIALNFFSTLVLTRYLGLEDYGSYQLILSYAGVCQIFARPGLSLVISKAGVREYDNLIPKALRQSLLSAIGFAGMLLVVAMVGRRLDWLPTQAMAVAGLLGAFTVTAVLGRYEQILQAKKRFRTSRYLGLVQAGLSLILTGWLAWMTGSYLSALAGLLATQVGVALTGLTIAMAGLRPVADDPDLESQLWREGRSYGWLAIVTQVAVQLDKLIIGHWDAGLLAVYSIGSFVPKRIKDNLKILISVCTVHGGRMSRKNNLAFIRRNLPRVFAASSLPVLAIWAGAGYFYPSLYGPDYADAVWVAQWLSLPLPFLVASLLVSYFDIYQSNGEFYRGAQLFRQVTYSTIVAGSAYFGELAAVTAAVTGLEICYGLITVGYFYRRIATTDALATTATTGANL